MKSEKEILIKEHRAVSVSPNRVSEDVGSEVSVRDGMALKADGHHVAVAGLEAEWLGHEDVPVRSAAVLVNTSCSFRHDGTNLISCVYKPETAGKDYT